MSFENDKKLLASVLRSLPKPGSLPRTKPVHDFKEAQLWFLFRQHVIEHPHIISQLQSITPALSDADFCEFMLNQTKMSTKSMPRWCRPPDSKREFKEAVRYMYRHFYLPISSSGIASIAFVPNTTNAVLQCRSKATVAQQDSSRPVIRGDLVCVASDAHWNMLCSGNFSSLYSGSIDGEKGNYILSGLLSLVQHDCCSNLGWARPSLEQPFEDRLLQRRRPVLTLEIIVPDESTTRIESSSEFVLTYRSNLASLPDCRCQSCSEKRLGDASVSDGMPQDTPTLQTPLHQTSISNPAKRRKRDAFPCRTSLAACSSARDGPVTEQLRSWRHFFHKQLSRECPLYPCGSRITGSGEDAYSRLSNAAVDLIAQTVGLSEEWVCVDFGCGEGVALLQLHHAYHCARFLGLEKQSHLVARARGLSRHLFPTLDEAVMFQEVDVLDASAATAAIEAALFGERAPTRLFALVNNVNYGPLLNQAIANILHTVQEMHRSTQVTVVAFQALAYGRAQHLSVGEKWIQQACETVFKHREMQKYKYGALEWRMLTWLDCSPIQALSESYPMTVPESSIEWCSDSDSGEESDEEESDEEYAAPPPQPMRMLRASAIKERRERLCQYQTSPQAVIEVLNHLGTHLNKSPRDSHFWDSFDLWIEPSAGEGAFYKNLPPKSRLGIDIDSSLKETYPEYVIGDFLTLDRDALSIGSNVLRAKTVVIGNPPFSVSGRCRGGLRNPVVDFINHASTLADTVIFIVPPTMNRPTLQDRVSRELHLIINAPLKDDSFEQSSEGVQRPVKCLVQLWARKTPSSDRPLLYEGVPEVNRQDGSWIWQNGLRGDFDFLFPVDPQANLMVCRFGDVGTVVHDMARIKANQQALDRGKKAVESTRGATGYFYLRCRDPATVKQRLESSRARTLFEKYRQSCVGTAASLNLRDVVHVYTESTLLEVNEKK